MLKPELLAPAGDWKSFIAAVEAGADAVYFGGKDFSARSFAINFDQEEIKKAIDYAQLRGVKTYAAVNTLVKDGEFADLFDYINFLYTEGIDALIIQDLGVLNMVSKYFPDLPLHASTQMSAHNLQDVLALEKMGFKRVILARELTLEEIQEIKKKSKIEIECFVHGALCFSYSGQCLLSSMIGGRSGNRGRCAQPCRKKYVLVEGKNGESKDVGGYLLSAKDLCALDILNKMQFTPTSKQIIDDKCNGLSIKLGGVVNGQNGNLLRWGFIDSLKIEGRMKGAAYVGGVIEKYRKAIDSAARNEKILPERMEADKKELAGIFNRGGFSHGFLLEKKPKDLVSPERSKNFGVLAGEVIGVSHSAIRIRTIDVGVNDGLEIWGRGGQEKNVGFRVEKMSGDIIDLVIAGDIRIGDKVYKNYDYKLNKKLEALAEENYQKKFPVKMIFRAKEGENITLEIYPRLFKERKNNALKNNIISKNNFAKIDKIQKAGVKTKGAKAETAIKIKTSEDVAREQLSKLGATPFMAEKIDIEIIGKVYIPLKNLNNLRREAALKLEKEIMNSFKREKKQEELSTIKVSVIVEKGNKTKTENSECRIVVQSDNLSVLDELAGLKIRRIYTALKIDIEKFHKNNIEVYQSLPRILREGEKLEIFADYNGFLAPALGYLDALPEKAKKTGDFSLNIFNSYSARELKKLGFSGFTASLENTLDEINNLSGENLEKETIVYGFLPLMIAEHCVLHKTKYCVRKNFSIYSRLFSRNNENTPEGKLLFKKNSSISNAEYQKAGVKDEMGKVFPLVFDCVNCRMRILNSAPLYFTDIDNLKVDSIRLIHTIEQPEKFLKIVENYITGDFGSVENTTTGHFYRGVE